MENNSSANMESGAGGNPVPMQQQARTANPFGTGMSAGAVGNESNAAGENAMVSKQKNKRLTIILVVVAAVILAVVGGVLIWSKISEDKAANNTGDNTNEGVDLDDDVPVGDGDSGDSGGTPVSSTDLDGSGIKAALVSAFEASSTYNTSTTYNYRMESINYSGAYEGYMNAVMTVGMSGSDGAIGGFAGVFYKVPSGEWKYFVGTQGVIDCVDYDTDDLKKAFSGDRCWTAEGNEGVVE